MVGLAALVAAAAFVGGGAQAQYDYARDLEESVAGRADDCAATTRRYARALIMEAEAFDRLKPAVEHAAGVRARVAKSRLRSGCRVERTPVVAELDAPRSGEVAIAGAVTVRAPRGTRGFDLYANGRRVGGYSAGPTVSLTLTLEPGRYVLRARFRPRGEQVSRGVWLLPARSAGVAFAAQRADPRIEQLGRRFDGWAGIWTHDLTTGRAAGWNETAAFPAASTVKLGVLAAALRRYGPRSALSYDLYALTRWSSNLAANRLYRLLGWSRVRAGLYALGMGASTYTGEYRVGTALGAPPRVSGRVTTARDLGRALYRLHASALGHGFGLDRTKLTVHEARIALGYLLSFDRAEANRGLFPLVFPTAEKNGWLDDAQHTAALVYTPLGPKIVVVLTYRSGLREAEARALGSRVYKLSNP